MNEAHFLNLLLVVLFAVCGRRLNHAQIYASLITFCERSIIHWDEDKESQGAAALLRCCAAALLSCRTALHCARCACVKLIVLLCKLTFRPFRGEKCQQQQGERLQKRQFLFCFSFDTLKDADTGGEIQTGRSTACLNNELPWISFSSPTFGQFLLFCSPPGQLQWCDHRPKTTEFDGKITKFSLRSPTELRQAQPFFACLGATFSRIRAVEGGSRIDHTGAEEGVESSETLDTNRHLCTFTNNPLSQETVSVIGSLSLQSWTACHWAIRSTATRWHLGSGPSSPGWSGRGSSLALLLHLSALVKSPRKKGSIPHVLDSPIPSPLLSADEQVSNTTHPVKTGRGCRYLKHCLHCRRSA